MPPDRHVLVRLSPELYAELRGLAEAEQCSAAEVLRQGLRRHLVARQLDGELPPTPEQSRRSHPSAWRDREP